MTKDVKRVLITGGTGFIGSALVERLLERNVGVDVLTRNRRRAEAQFRGRVRAVERLDEIRHDDILEMPDVIVNLAGKNLGEDRWSRRVKSELVRSRVEVTEEVVSYIRAANPRPRLLISGSAVGYYGHRENEVLGETAKAGDEFQSRLCAQWEAAAMQAADYGVRICISRTGAVIGPGGGVISGLVPLFKAGLGAVIASGEQWISWIHLEDLLRIFDDFIMDDSLSGVFNNTSPHPVRNREFAQALGRALGRPVLLKIPGPVYRLMFGGLAHLHITGQYVTPARHVNRGFEYRYPRIDAAIEAAL